MQREIHKTNLRTIISPKDAEIRKLRRSGRELRNRVRKYAKLMKEEGFDEIAKGLERILEQGAAVWR